jgi:DNA-directed RNA polymerase specialized sigma24 family protein
MDVRRMLRRVYGEITNLESLRRQRNMIIEDCSGIKAVQYDSEKVQGGGQESDLSGIVENIEKRVARIDKLIAMEIDRIMEHREELYDLLAELPASAGKTAVEEHYLHHVPWEEVSEHLHYSESYIKKMAQECIDELQRICDEREYFLSRSDVVK